MKILRKDDKFIKMHDKTMEDIIKINSMIKNGYTFTPKKEYKEFFKSEKTATEVKSEAKKAEKKEKKIKEVKDVRDNIKKKKK